MAAGMVPCRTWPTPGPGPRRAGPDRSPTRRPLIRARAEVGLSVVQDRQVELAKALGVSDQVDFEDR